MGTLNILFVEDEAQSAAELSDLLKKAGGGRLASEAYGPVDVVPASNQQDAQRFAEEARYDIVLLDLEYPAVAGGPIDRDSPNRFCGLQWLPELRRLQPGAAIVILTKYAQVENILAALREGAANDFLAKTDPFDSIAARIQTAWKNAAKLRRAERGREEFWDLLRSEAARVYAEDVGALISQVKSPLYRIAREIESQDGSAVREAPNRIRDAFTKLWDEYKRLTAALPRANEKMEEFDLVEDLIKPTAEVYNGVIKTPVPLDPPVRLTTYRSDVRVALHELLRNALEYGTGPVEIMLERVDGGANIHVINHQGFSGEAINHLFEPGFTTKANVPQHSGRGLWLARRLLRAIGGDVNAGNDEKGRAHVTITVRDLGVK
jgi:signal transduction histidine kinase